MVQIDLMSSYTPDNATIEAMMQQFIDSQYPPAMREKIIRMGGANLATLNDFFANTCTPMKLKAISDRDLLKSTIEYEQAVVRLSQVELSVGRLAQTVSTGIQETDTVTGAPIFDANNQPVYIMETIPAIDPLPTTITVPDGSGGTVTEPNPPVAQDEAERATAQAIITNATAAVVALATQRKV